MTQEPALGRGAGPAGRRADAQGRKRARARGMEGRGAACRGTPGNGQIMESMKD
jgi:hypothetical protein